MQYKTLTEISDECGIRYHTLYSRLKRDNTIRTKPMGQMILVHKGDVGKLTHAVAPASPKTHGKTGSWIYSRWTSLLHHHKGHICEEWLSFENFFRDVGEPETRKARLTRIDIDQPWSHQNCEWKYT